MKIFGAVAALMFIFVVMAFGMRLGMEQAERQNKCDAACGIKKSKVIGEKCYCATESGYELVK